MMRPQTLFIALLLALGFATCKSFERSTPSEAPPATPSPAIAEEIPVVEEPTGPAEVRALWVARMAYKTQDDVKAIIRNAHAHHFNLILWQVRGNATVYYPSSFEPWAWELTGEDPTSLGRDPGWDPLALALSEAHTLGMELHAWVNVFPAWKQTTPPPEDTEQLWNTRRHWFMQNQAGGRMWPQDWWTYWYTFLDPGVPEVQQHLVNVFSEIVSTYAVDGIHFDYIRYPAEVGDWGYNSTSIERFQAHHQNLPDISPSTYPDLWADWKRAQITELVHTVSEEVRTIQPGIMISSAVLHNWKLAHRDYAQDARTWLSHGTLDASFPMLYHYKPDDFRYVAQDHLSNSHGQWVLPGLHPSRHTLEDVLELINMSRELGAMGMSLFSYRGLFPDHEPSEIMQAVLDGPYSERASLPDRQ